MRVYGLSGKSGTGKSYQAMNLCREFDIESMVDDGLFIYNNSVLAGHSAKRDENKITAIRTAIFDKEEDRAAVADKIREVMPESILVIGTSDSMVERIASRLGLPEPDPIIHIEDIVDGETISTALQSRREGGKHVIPVPTMEIQKQFSGYFMIPLRMFLDRNGKEMPDEEKTVVRPTYSYLGNFTIAHSAVIDIMEYVVSRTEGVREILKCSADIRTDGVILNIACIFDFNERLMERVRELQESLASEVSHMTAFNILSVNVIIRGLKPVRKHAVNDEE
ncbi:MAG: hypothetical protein K6D03_09750 [Solobacterium sp.]|nr:hypothetical protein [Solobacterium sp.]